MTSQLGPYTRSRLLFGGIIEDHLAQVTSPRGREKTLVLQCLRSDMAEDVGFAEMFLDTARHATLLDHPNIVKVFDFGVTDGTYFLAREHIEGPTLRKVLNHMAAQRMTLPATLCARIISQVCAGLAFAHDLADSETGAPLRLIHRCVRPYNILLSHQGQAMMVDFGVDELRSRFTPRLIPLLHEEVYTGPDVMSRAPMDRRMDVYSLGVVLYELLTQRKPFEATPEKSVMQAILTEPMIPAERHRPDLPDALRAILARALAKERDERYPDCHAFKADLEEFIRSTGESVKPKHVAQLAQQVSPASDRLETQPRPFKKRGRVLAAAVGLVLLLGGGLLLWRRGAAPEPPRAPASTP
ncbi:serine/threonine-protein kinase [Myxococcus sp. MISCRS1]|uniref:serine/threonine protein kinase n=1 Tax=Myxococcus sp. MISCRS1 TaxID=2996786 RepID=UPI002271A38C|nr:serine/threonine-protein kinase [Myxococcus sp. MISCRS1]MCY0997878.1 serine/threonine-protein kinase [Myxococcus sp. MISCRS1]